MPFPPYFSYFRNRTLLPYVPATDQNNKPMKTSKLALLLLILTFISCMEDQQLSGLDKGPAPVGIWSHISYQDNSLILEKGPKLQDNTYGYRFLSNGKLIHRANSGFCGTPPIATSDFEGTWQRDGDIIRLEAGFWGGTQIQEWKILSDAGNSLQVEVISSELEMKQ